MKPSVALASPDASVPAFVHQARPQNVPSPDATALGDHL